MNVEYSGWTCDHGFFHHNVFVDETKTDYEIHFDSGIVAKQSSPFQAQTADWNHDGDVYTQYGAWFERRDKDGVFCGGEFWTPEQMVRAVADAIDGNSRSYGEKVVRIPGIEIPSRENRSSLEDQILKAERRKEAQDIERSRKMNDLGIRSPDDPRVK